MERISKITTESISLSIVDNNQRKCIQSIEGAHELSALTYVGQTSPLYAGASAKVLLASFSKEELKQYIEDSHLETITDYTIIDKDELIKDLNEIKHQGFALSYGERVEGATSLSVPIFNPSSRVLAALSLTIPSVRMDNYNLEKLTRVMTEGANEIMKQLK